MQKTSHRKGLKTTVAALVLSLAATGAVAPSANAATNVIPDDALRACVNRDLNIWAAKWKPEVGNRSLGAPVTAADMQNYLRTGSLSCNHADLQKLAVSKKSVTSLEGLQYATHLTSISVVSSKSIADNQKVTSLEPVAKLSGLQRLNLGYNNISTLPADMAGMKSLWELNLEGNKLTTISSVRGLSNLKRLNVGYNSVNSLVGIENLTKMEGLFAYHNRIPSLEPARNLVNMTELIIDNNRITNISAVARMSKLKEFNFAYNNHRTPLGYEPQVLDISALAGKPLTKLNLFNNKVADISALSTVKTLTEVDLKLNMIADLSPLKASPGSVKTVAPQFPDNTATKVVTRKEINNKTEIDISKLKTPAGTTPAISKVVVLGSVGQVSFTQNGSKIVLPNTYQNDVRVFYKAQGINGEEDSYITVKRESPATAAPIVFSDVKSNDQFYNEIMWLANSGITTGWNMGTHREYRPLSNVERGAMAAFFYRMAGEPAYTAPAKPTFKDVPTTHPFYKEIEWMASKKITTGWEDGTFRPENPVNRDAMAAFFYRMAGKPAYTAPSKSPFTDVKTNDQFYKEISWLANKGITKGWPDGSFQPVTAINRDAMAAFIYRYSTR